VQLAAANSALLLVESIRWDAQSRTWRLPRDDGALAGLAIPPEFQRDLGLGRLQAAIRERAAIWQRIIDRGPIAQIPTPLAVAIAGTADVQITGAPTVG
jgi:hypothetical protein